MMPIRHSIDVANFADAVGTHKIIFYEYGPATGRPLVCVHGLRRNAHDFDLLAEALAAKNYRVLTLSMAGRGESEWLEDPAGYNNLAYVQDCLQILDQFNLRHVDWIGTSMGGMIAMLLASQHPGSIGRLVLNDIGARISSQALKRIFAYVSEAPEGFANYEEAEHYLRATSTSFGVTDPALWRRFVDQSLTAKSDGTFIMSYDPKIMDPVRLATKNFTDIGDIDLFPLWETIQIPTLILRGEQSDVLSFETVEHMLATNPKASSVMIKGVGHAPALMSKDQISLIEDWLAKS